MDIQGYQKSFSVDQGLILGNDQLFQSLYHAPLTDSKRQGICGGLTLIWLARRMMFEGETPAQRRSALMAMSGFRWGGKSQDIIMNAGDPGGTFQAFFEHAYKDTLRAYALSIQANSSVDYTTGDIAAAAKSFAPSLTAAKSYRIWNLGLTTNTGTAAHAIASYASHGKLGYFRHLYVFDPNMGEYKIDIDDTESFTKALLQSYATNFQGVRWIASAGVGRG